MCKTQIFVMTALVVSGLCGPAPAAKETPTDSAVLDIETIDIGCAELVEMGEKEYALVVCQKEFDDSLQDPVAIRRLAELEFKYGDSERSLELWQSLIDLEGWSQEAASGKAMALWRAGKRDDADKLFHENLERDGSEPAYTDLISFLLAFNRWPEAVEVADKAMSAYPETCGYAELAGVAEAGQHNDTRAAELFARAVDKGCQQYRWATLGPVPQRLTEPPYMKLLIPTELVAGLREVSDRECEQRFRLLGAVVTAEVAPLITDEVLLRDKLEVRFEGLGLLSRLGSSVMTSWQRLLADDDFLLRKYTLRRIRELGDPAFIQLIEKHLSDEKSKRNLALTRLTLAELLLVKGEADRADQLVREIPPDDPRFAVGLTSLADAAEERGDIAMALRFLDEALAADPEVFVDRQRLDKLRADVEKTEGTGLAQEN